MRINKHILAFILGSVLLLTGTACNKLLEKNPESTIADPSKYFKSKRDATSFMAGVYNSMQVTLRTNIFDWGEVRSDNVNRAGTGTSQAKLLNNVLSANDTDLNGVTNWNNLYRTIALCNVGIENFPIMIANNYEQGAKDYRDWLGQCYSMRAFMYFYALRIWGRVPIVTKVVSSLDQEMAFPRSSIKDVKAQILSDITESLKYIGNSPTKKYYWQMPAVYALQTDVYMWFQEYNNALTASDKIFANKAYDWVKDARQWKDIFLQPDNSTETIFNMFWGFEEFGNGVGICQKVGSGSNTSQYRISDKIFVELFNRIDPSSTTGNTIRDGRLYQMFDPQFTSIAEYLALTDGDFGKFGKFMPFDPTTQNFIYTGNNECSVKMPIYRYADVMLLRAEAFNATGDHQKAIDILNAVRKRVGSTQTLTLANFPTDANSTQARKIQLELLEERQVELVAEGKRWFDLMRIDKTYNVDGAGEYTPDFTATGYTFLRNTMNPVLATRFGAVQYTGDAIGRILFPINTAVIQANPKLRGDQNFPYSE